MIKRADNDREETPLLSMVTSGPSSDRKNIIKSETFVVSVVPEAVSSGSSSHNMCFLRSVRVYGYTHHVFIQVLYRGK